MMRTEVTIIGVFNMGPKGYSIDFKMGKNTLTDCMPSTRINPPVKGETWYANGQGRLIERKL